jgi:serine/threonine protein kinase
MLGLEFIHSLGYIYRNLVPQNLIFDKKGYIHINDMTLIREKSNNNYLITSGHSGYMAPEIIFRNNYGIESDFYSLGVILYEIMFNRLPYKSNSREEYLNDLASNHNALIKEDELNVGWSRECADFINRCIQKRAELRIGYGGIEELKSHIWLKDLDWERLKKRELPAPFIPNNKNNFNIRNNDKDKITFMEENIKNFVEYYEVMNYFKGYYYNYNIDKNYKKETIKKKEINNEQIDDKKDANDDNLGETSKENDEEEKDKDFMNNNDIMNKFDYLKNTKKKNYNKINEENSDNDDDDDNQININLDKRKKNRKKKEDDDDDDDYDKINYKENRNQKRKKKDTTDTRNFFDEESKRQLMNIKKKKGLLNKNSKNRKSIGSREVLNIYKKKNNYDD